MVKRSPSTRTWLSPPPPSDCSSMRSRPSGAAHRRPPAPVSSGSAPSPRLDWSMRWLVKWMRAVTPFAAGAVSASRMAWASGLGDGVRPPPVAARAIAAPAAARTTIPAQRASRRRVEMRRKNLIGASVADPFSVRLLREEILIPRRRSDVATEDLVDARLLVDELLGGRHLFQHLF